MPSQKPLHKYPREYPDLFFRVGKTGQLRMHCASNAGAENLRRDLYNYRQALREETPLPPTEHDHNLLSIANSLTFSIDGPFLIIEVNETVYVPLIRQALED